MRLFRSVGPVQQTDKELIAGPSYVFAWGATQGLSKRVRFLRAVLGQFDSYLQLGHQSEKCCQRAPLPPH